MVNDSYIIIVNFVHVHITTLESLFCNILITYFDKKKISSLPSQEVLCTTRLIKAKRFNKQLFGFILSCISVLWNWIVRKYANNRSMIHILLPSSLGCLIYLNSMCGDMVHDDIPAILKNPDVNGKNQWHTAFSNDFWGNAMSDITSHKSYRPITTLLFR